MKRQLSEEQLDSLMRRLVSDASADEAMVNEIADSPAMWWGVQRQIDQQKEARSPWPPPIPKFWRSILVGVPVAAALLIAFLLMRPAMTVDDRATASIPMADVPFTAVPVVQTGSDELPASQPIRANADSNENKPAAVKAVFTAPERKRVPRLTAAAVKKAEIKTEFIALSYGRNPESGQIVRVKVPSSMMVTVGLVPAVQRPTSMIDAEVVVGDDGMTHAIRFIR